MASCVTVIRRLLILISLSALFFPDGATAQRPGAGDVAEEGDAALTVVTGGLITLGSEGEERLRLDQILGRRGTTHFLLRSASTLNQRPQGPAQLAFLFGGVQSTWNSALPFSGNDGAMWAGRGMNVQATGGVRFDMSRLSVILSPRVTYQQNLDFQTVPYERTRDGSRSPYSSPWYDRPESIDMPMRFGSTSFGSADLGQSSITLTVGPLAVGAATENLWWGPGIRNAIVMSNHAPGIPHAFLRTSDPLSTPIGDFEGRWIVGRLDESDYFDDDSSNDTRSISALALTYRPVFEPNLSLGVARAVYAPAKGGWPSAGALFDVFRSVGRPNAIGEDDLLREPGGDQLFSAFGRWVFPQAGFEAYGEWARYEQPGSLRDLLVLPQHSQAYTAGLQWARMVGDSSTVRLQTEVSYLEPSSSYDRRREIAWYTSRPVKQGYTHRGQVIGASIGPGASSQWVAADLFRQHGSRVGAFFGRIRWDNYAFYRMPQHPFFGHDVSLFGGLRAGYRIGGMDIAAEYALEGRMNYLYQSPSPDWDAQEAVDIRNHTLRLTVTPGLP